MDQDVFVVSTPLQYLNAREAASYFGSHPATLVLVPTHPAYSRQLFRDLGVFRDWSTVRFVPIPKHLRGVAKRDPMYAARVAQQGIADVVGLSRLVCAALRARPVRRAILGHHGTAFHRAFAHACKPQEFVLLDDGAATVDVSRQRVADGTRGARGLRRRLLDLCIPPVKRSTFFTTYDLEAAPHDHVVRHDFPVLRAGLRNKKRVRQLLFVGQPLVRLGVIAPETELRLLNQVRRRHESLEFIYSPHPTERDEDIVRVRDSMGVRVERHEHPVEVELIQRDALPEVVAGFYSSALHNLHNIFRREIRVCAFVIPDRAWKLAAGHPSRIATERYYDHLRTLGSEWLQVEPLD